MFTNKAREPPLPLKAIRPNRVVKVDSDWNSDQSESGKREIMRRAGIDDSQVGTENASAPSKVEGVSDPREMIFNAAALFEPTRSIFQVDLIIADLISTSIVRNGEQFDFSSATQFQQLT